MPSNDTNYKGTDDSPRVGQLIGRITDDVKAIALDEIELAKAEASRTLKTAIVNVSAIIVGGVVALLGLGFLATAAVVALEPAIPSLALRLVIMAVVYAALGAAFVIIAAKRLKSKIPPALDRTKHEAMTTVDAVKEELSHA